METANQKATVVSFQADKPPKQRLSLSRRTISIIIVALVLVIGIGALLLAKNKDEAAKVTSVATVDITETGFNPLTIRVKKGDRITWVNKDAKPHQVAADPHPTGESLPTLKSEDPLMQDESYTAVMEKPGTYTYHDYLDPVGFQATIIVD